MKKLIGITMGDPSGIGPEIIVKVLAKGCPNLRVYGTLDILVRTAKQLGLNFDHSTIFNIDNGYNGKDSLELGKPTQTSGFLSYNYVKSAVSDCLNNRIQAIVTAPISKFAWKLASIEFPGHTELLAKLSNPILPPTVRMLLKSDSLNIVLDSTHLSLKSAISNLNSSNLLETAIITNAWFQKNLNKKPKIVLAALNPHAGENGAFGEEEKSILQPTVALAKTKDINISGPFSADTIFMNAMNNEIVVISLYHDQALIPFKLNGLDKGINITMGLDFFRSSVDHGTAFDIAGKGLASEVPLLKAIKMTQRMIEKK
ncbi:MAG: 4-hydroxythreonine-4-phosphate dehydrogenase PdxA [Betaproteobacteria bacterium TMED82]|nr:MAG: 4-hydroxythreonine-4-phosphate dehydrogenase PdxA [Betaproteobacteria bacterium TMED82]|tara:strand:+ start:35759 stop:36703 length:945 start_codon:yes stop_codon:yes gene_type:complete